MRVGTVCELWRYPVKSMRGERLPGARLSERGVDGDRMYAVRDQQTGKIASAKHPRLWGALLQCVAQFIEPAGAVGITLPNGRRIIRGQDDVDAALTALTGRAVHLVDVVPERAEIERYWPDVDGLGLHDTVTANEIGRGAPAGTFFDYAPLHVLTTAALARLSSLHPTGQVDSRRFRPNLVIETPEEVQGFAENLWVGRILLIGPEVRLRVSDPAPRCVVPTLPQGQLPRDIGILRAIANFNRPPVPAMDGERLPCLGIYATVERSGLVRVGDAVRIAAVG
jgi:uncharacterized protein